MISDINDQNIISPRLVPDLDSHQEVRRYYIILVMITCSLHTTKEHLID